MPVKESDPFFDNYDTTGRRWFSLEIYRSPRRLLNCTIIYSSGSTIGTGFSIARALKRNKRLRCSFCLQGHPSLFETAP